MAYSLNGGRLIGTIIGRAVAFVAAPQPIIVIEAGHGRLKFYDPANLTPHDELTFSRALSLIRMTTDGKKLFVVMVDQVAYLIDVSGTTAPIAINPTSSSAATPK